MQSAALAIRFKRLVNTILVALTLCAASATRAEVNLEVPQFLELSPSTVMDLEQLLDQLEASKEQVADTSAPVVIILHGREAEAFTDLNYQASLVSRAERLQAGELIDVRMCATWAKRNMIEPEQIPSFIQMVPFAPEEIRRLKKDGYRRYSRGAYLSGGRSPYPPAAVPGRSGLRHSTLRISKSI